MLFRLIKIAEDEFVLLSREEISHGAREHIVAELTRRGVDASEIESALTTVKELPSRAKLGQYFTPGVSRIAC